MDWLHTLRARWHLGTSGHRTQLEALPEPLYAFWARSVAQEYPSLPRNRYTFLRAAEGLVYFFKAVSAAGRACALPSAAADSVWHAWLAWNRINLGTYGSTHFGRDVTHLPNASLATTALAHTLVLCRELEGKPAHGPDLPSLFTLDREVRMPGGHGYFRTAEGIMYVPLSPRGRPERRPALHPKLTPDTLLAAGLITRRQYAALLRQQRMMSDDTAATWTGADTTALAFADADDSSSSDHGDSLACDASSSDSGSSDCGSSCGGSSCGGGGGD